MRLRTCDCRAKSSQRHRARSPAGTRRRRSAWRRPASPARLALARLQSCNSFCARRPRRHQYRRQRRPRGRREASLLRQRGARCSSPTRALRALWVMSRTKLFAPRRSRLQERSQTQSPRESAANCRAAVRGSEGRAAAPQQSYVGPAPRRPSAWRRRSSAASLRAATRVVRSSLQHQSLWRGTRQQQPGERLATLEMHSATLRHVR